ncbi:hypothetical protein CC80DRAFT_568555 [Byssothecium circinans]|uniref:Uncharacterized protein n=1 Tax=Byssothecium circinans TaxID=147558 RepID=A0A6A5TPY2_9PLEO|nr:hypothetical protein CC80DRAFT_568555 [Byssothecium circinans]
MVAATEEEADGAGAVDSIDPDAPLPVGADDPIRRWCTGLPHDELQPRYRPRYKPSPLMYHVGIYWTKMAFLVQHGLAVVLTDDNDNNSPPEVPHAPGAGCADINPYPNKKLKLEQPKFVNTYLKHSALETTAPVNGITNGWIFGPSFPVQPGPSCFQTPWCEQALALDVPCWYLSTPQNPPKRTTKDFALGSPFHTAGQQVSHPAFQLKKIRQQTRKDGGTEGAEAVQAFESRVWHFANFFVSCTDPTLGDYRSLRMPPSPWVLALETTPIAPMSSAVVVVVKVTSSMSGILAYPAPQGYQMPWGQGQQLGADMYERSVTRTSLRAKEKAPMSYGAWFQASPFILLTRARGTWRRLLCLLQQDPRISRPTGVPDALGPGSAAGF